ncbi:MAG: hypothetical protein SGJ11_09605, partial [Phycisphaerae bacterium]|nr:hypothetical protein [Phycisphaerae bacterium]
PPATPPVTPPATAPDAKPAADLPEGKALVAKHLAAMGTKEAIDSITSSHYKGSIDSMMGKIELEVAAMKPNRMLLVQSMGGMKNQTGFDGVTGWTNDPQTGEIHILSEEMIAGMDGGSDLQALVRKLDERFSGFTTTGKETVDGTEVYLVKMAEKGGDQVTGLFDATTALLKGIRTASQGPQGAMNSTILLADWMDVPVGETEKIKVFKTMIIEQGGMRMNATFTDFEFNELDEKFFAAPEAVKELARKQKDAAAPSPTDGGAAAPPTTPATAPPASGSPGEPAKPATPKTP